jgi:tRNA A37 threonylcarbamoyladenosine biosynthesis protein TsaE
MAHEVETGQRRRHRTLYGVAMSIVAAVVITGVVIVLSGNLGAGEVTLIVVASVCVGMFFASRVDSRRSV